MRALQRRPARLGLLVLGALLVAALLFPGLAAAQGTAKAAAAPQTISGTVNRASDGASLSNVYVTLYQRTDWGGHYWYDWTYTDATGQYGFTVPDGQYVVEFANPVTWQYTYWDSKWDLYSADPITIAGGIPVVANQALQMPATSIEGRVTDETGSPVYDIGVVAYRLQDWGGGYYEWNGYTSTQTSGDGTYSLYGLPDGTYRIGFQDWYGYGYYDEFFDDAPDLGSATDIKVVDGQTFVADAALQRRLPLRADKFEPDNVMSAAKSIATDGSVALHSTYPGGDRDWVKFPVEAGKQYNVSARYLSLYSYDSRVAIFDEDGQPLRDGYGRASWVAKTSGTLYARITYGDYSSEVDWYRLSVTESDPTFITGTVTADNGGAPISKVWVELERKWADPWGDWWEWGGSTQTDDAGHYTLDAFESSGPLDTASEYRLGFQTWETPGYVREWYNDKPRQDMADVIKLQPGENVFDAQLASAAFIQGTVRDEDSGAPLVEVPVQLYRTEYLSGYGMSTYEWGWSWTDSLGRFDFGSLRPGTYKVRYGMTDGPYQVEWWDDKVDVASADPVVLESGDVKECNADLALRDDAIAVRGKVTDRATDEPIAGIGVRVEPVLTAPDGGATSGYFGMSSYWTQTAIDGSYVVGGPGKPMSGYNMSGYSLSWRISYRDQMSGYLPQWWNDKPTEKRADLVQLPLGECFVADAKLDLDLTKGVVSGRVTGEDTGEPVKNGWVHVHLMSSYDMSGYWESWVDGQGNYKLRGLPAGIPFALHAGTEGEYLSEYYENKPVFELADPITLAVGENRTIDFQLSKPAALSGTVTEDGTGKPISGIEVQIYQPGYASGYGQSGYFMSGYEFIGSAYTTKSGGYTLPWLNPLQTYYIKLADENRGLWVSNFYDHKATIEAADPIHLSSGANTLDMSMARRTDIGQISGVVTDRYSTDPIGGIQVDLYYSGSVSGYGMSGYGMSGYWGGQLTAPDGTYFFDGLPVGLNFKAKFSDPNDKFFMQWFDGTPFGASSEADATFISPGSAVFTADAALRENQAPQVFDDIMSPYDASATFELWAVDQGSSGVKSLTYSIDGGDPVVVNSASTKVTVSTEGPHSVTYYAEDNAGNVSGMVYVPFTVLADATAPVVHPQATSDTTYTPTPGGPIWRSSPVTVTAETYELGSGIKSISYSTDGITYLPYTAPLKFTADGAYKLWFAAEDNAGNPSDVATIEFTIDGTAPTVSATVAPAANADGWRAAPATLTLNANDGAGAGVESRWYKIGDGAKTAYTAPVELPAGDITVTFGAVDYLGNEATDSIGVKSDGTKPTASATLTSAKTYDEYRTSPVTVTIDASDGSGSGVAAKYFTTASDGSGYSTYTQPLEILDEGPHTVWFYAQDKVGNTSDASKVQFTIDNTAPGIPGTPAWSAITTSTIDLTWAESVDAASGLALYDVYKNGVLYQTVTTNSLEVTGLTPSSTNVWKVRASDHLGNTSGFSAEFSVTQPALTGEVNVPSGQTTVTVSVTGLGDVTFGFDDVTEAGVLKISSVTGAPKPADGTFKFMNAYYDINFTGEFSGNVRITLPYDPAIPDARAKNLKIAHWTGTGWDQITPTSVDTVAHTVTFTVDGFSPFALAEASAVDTSVSLSAGWGKVSNTAKLTVAYGGRGTLIGYLKDASGNAVSNKAIAGSVVVERLDLSSGKWITYAAAKAHTLPGFYTWTSPALIYKTAYRMRFVGDAYNSGIEGPERWVEPMVKFSKPRVPARAGHSNIRVTGTIAPAHTKGSLKVVQLKLYKWSTTRRRWLPVKTFSAKMTTSTTYSGYVRATTDGTYAVRAYAPDEKTGVYRHAATYSVYSASIKVK